ncbi:helix-turn-helix domain-containing protein [Roseitranquillus sediminis]|uniref:helix-turn-helix domain-containing protein n=1 Tax=Roseitranquillus sediminis TaxID=2809051 RepID=UPI001D0C3E40|nr:helix-turn-helix transcriptional regulator [Roseitranquillus sediminis]MBM9593301.1 helix-turn-helix domain-containing protein [Roseitranquillus sediminis]
MGDLNATTGFARGMLERDPALNRSWNAHASKRRLALWLRAARREARLTQKALAERAGMSQPQISRMEDATGPLPDLSTIHAYLRGCGRVVLLSHSDPADAPPEHVQEAHAIAV